MIKEMPSIERVERWRVVLMDGRQDINYLNYD
jgi:hypothetical protein